MLAFPHLKSTATSRSEKVFQGLTIPHPKPTATAWSGRGGDKNIRAKRRRAVTAAILLRNACLWGGGAQSAGSRAMVDGGGVWSAYLHC